MRNDYLIILAIILVALAVVFAPGLLPVHAATVNGCETIGTIGNVIVARCIDDMTGLVVFGNSLGMMVVEP